MYKENHEIGFIYDVLANNFLVVKYFDNLWKEEIDMFYLKILLENPLFIWIFINSRLDLVMKLKVTRKRKNCTKHRKFIG